MTKADIIAAVAEKTKLSKKASQEALEAILDTITTELANGGSVTLTGFGTFKISARKARTGVNPQNPSQKIEIPAMNLPAFKAGKVLKDAVR